ncbi:MAG: hypothetical protein N4A35_06960 [Flavobacteriales bacterium]|jgi:hypothetical protein|nr:hypothetical protein [Flavobacteriales bacterium]
MNTTSPHIILIKPFIKVSTTISLVVAFLGLSSCQQELSGKALHDKVTEPSNGLIKKVENEQFLWQIQYLPLEYMIAKEAKGKPLETATYLAIKKRKEGLQYYKIKLQSKYSGNILNNIPTQQQENEIRLQYFLNEFNQDLLLIDGQDTLMSSLYHFERNYGALDHNNILVAFPATANKNDKKLLFLDRVLGLGLQEITFRKEDLEKIAHLKLTTL